MAFGLDDYLVYIKKTQPLLYIEKKKKKERPQKLLYILVSKNKLEIRIKR